MDEDYGADFISVVDEEGNEIELEVVDSMDLDGREYMLFLPADMDEDDPDYGFVILQIVENGGEEEFRDLEDPEEEKRVYDAFMERLFGDEEE